MRVACAYAKKIFLSLLSLRFPSCASPNLLCGGGGGDGVCRGGLGGSIASASGYSAGLRLQFLEPDSTHLSTENLLRGSTVLPTSDSTSQVGYRYVV